MPPRKGLTKPARPESDYAFEAGVRYRHLKSDEKAAGGEGVWEYCCLEHAGGEITVNRVAIKEESDGRGDARILTLVNKWNRSAQTTGRTYYATF